MTRWLIAGMQACLIGMLASCSPTPRHVVVYVSPDEHIARPILEAFEAKTGIAVYMVGDTEVRKTTGLLDRIRAERGRPVADVLWSSEAIGTAALAREGLLAAHHSPVTEAWPTQWRSDDHTWHAFSPRPRVLVFDPARVEVATVPRTWQALTDPRWSGQIVVADPRFGTTGGHFAAMRWWAADHPETWTNWLDAMAAQHVRILPGGNAAVVDAVMRGEALLGATDADDVHAANAAGGAVSMVLPRHGAGAGQGPMLMPNTVAIVQGAPHSIEAAMLADYLLGDETAGALAASTSHNVPLSDRVGRDFPELTVGDPLVLDIDQIESHWTPAVTEAIDRWKPRADRADPS